MNDNIAKPATDSKKKRPRAEGERFVLEARLLLSDKARRELDKRFFIGCKMQNIVVKYAKNQLQQLHEDKAYREALSKYRELKIDKKLSVEEKAIAKADKETAKENLNAVVSSYHISEYDLQHYIVEQQHKYKNLIDSNSAQKIASSVSKGVNEVLYSNGKSIHFKKLSTFDSIEGKDNKMGIMLKHGDSGYYIKWLNLIMPMQIREQDALLQRALAENDISYCRIKRKAFSSGYRYFVQIVFKGKCPMKQSVANVLIKQAVPGKRVGIDLGPSTLAVTNESTCMLKLLADGVEVYNKEIERLSTILEYKRRVNNSQNYNNDGTVKRGVKLEWNNSKNYYKILWKLRDAYRRRSAFIVQSHNILANELLSLGDTFYIEDMDFGELAKRKEETVIDESTGLYESKRRLGKSIESRSPGLLALIIERKCKKFGKIFNKINTKTFRASQYNHITDTYEKKELSDRQTVVNNEEVQRDLYSAFLIMNTQDNLRHTDRLLCNETYSEFKKAHDRCIRAIKKAGRAVPSSFGIKVDTNSNTVEAKVKSKKYNN